MSKSLFHISEEYLKIIQQVEEADGELSSELEKSLSINESELESKCIGYHAVINMYEAQQAIVDKEMKRLAELKQSRQRNIDRLMQSLLDAVILFGAVDKKTGVKRLEFDTLKLSTRISKGGVVVHDEGQLDKKYCTFNLTVKKLPIDMALEIEKNLKEVVEEATEEASVVKVLNVDKKKLADDIKAIKARNEARKKLGQEDEIEQEEVPGAYISEDKFNLVIK